MAAEIKTDLNSKTLVRYALKGTALGFMVMIAVVFFTRSPETAGQIKVFPLEFIPVILFFVCGSWLCSGGRLWILSRAMGYRITLFQGLVAGLAAEFGVAATPGGVGGTVIRLVFMKKGGVPMTVGASILTADGALDVSFFVVLIPFALLRMGADPSWSPVMNELRSIPVGVMVSVAVLPAVLAVALLRKGGKWARWIEERLESFESAKKRRLAGRLRYARWKTRNAIVRILATTKFMFQRHRPALAIAFVLTGLQWFCRYGILPVILMAFAGAQSFLPLIVMQGLLLVMSLMILLPGGGGTVEMITTLALQQFVPLSAVGVVLILWRFFTYHLYLLVGGVVFFLTWGNLGRVFPPAEKL